MTIRINHILLPARDKDASARFLADILGCEVSDKSAGAPSGRFAVIRLDDGSTLDFAEMENVTPVHIAFEVTEDGFDAILNRLTANGVTYSADPRHRRQGEINANEGGRGLYFQDSDGHNFELLTKV
tara:strand:- start:585 stop:965 length:381 start_codon:yes stop_codon:yes gene_type:complete